MTDVGSRFEYIFDCSLKVRYIEITATTNRPIAKGVRAGGGRVLKLSRKRRKCWRSSKKEMVGNLLPSGLTYFYDSQRAVYVASGVPVAPGRKKMLREYALCNVEQAVTLGSYVTTNRQNLIEFQAYSK